MSWCFSLDLNCIMKGQNLGQNNSFCSESHLQRTFSQMFGTCGHGRHSPTLATPHRSSHQRGKNCHRHLSHVGRGDSVQRNHFLYVFRGGGLRPSADLRLPLSEEKNEIQVWAPCLSGSDLPPGHRNDTDKMGEPSGDEHDCGPNLRELA